MNHLELLFLVSLVSVSSIAVGIFIGFPMGQRHVLKSIESERRAATQRRAFDRLERARTAASGQVAPPEVRAAIHRLDSILDAETLEEVPHDLV